MYCKPRYRRYKEEVDSNKILNQSSKKEFDETIPWLLPSVEEQEVRKSELNGPHEISQAAGVPGCLVCIRMILIGLKLCIYESH